MKSSPSWLIHFQQTVQPNNFKCDKHWIVNCLFNMKLQLLHKRPLALLSGLQRENMKWESLKIYKIINLLVCRVIPFSYQTIFYILFVLQVKSKRQFLCCFCAPQILKQIFLQMLLPLQKVVFERERWKTVFRNWFSSWIQSVTFGLFPAVKMSTNAFPSGWYETFVYDTKQMPSWSQHKTCKDYFFPTFYSLFSLDFFNYYYSFAVRGFSALTRERKKVNTETHEI